MTGIAISISDMDYDKQRVVMARSGGRQVWCAHAFQPRARIRGGHIGFPTWRGELVTRGKAFGLETNGRSKCQTTSDSFTHPSHGTASQQLEAWMPQQWKNTTALPSTDCKCGGENQTRGIINTVVHHAPLA